MCVWIYIYIYIFIQVKSCSQGDVEIAVERIYVVSRAEVGLPLQIDDAGRSEEEIAEC